MPLISLIIPVYNVERFLRRCLDSVLAQTFAGWECILVDDGSPDGCPAICDEYAARDGRFRVVHKSRNEGLPAARKTGLDEARADFVMHIDSDDWLEHDALEALFAKQRETDADIVMGGFREIYPHKQTVYCYPEIAYGENILTYYFLNNCRMIWNKLFRKSLFDTYVIPENNLGEDALTTVQVFSKTAIHKLQKIDNIIYNYDHCGNGITTAIIKRYDCHTYKEFPLIKLRLWIEAYISRQADEVKSAFNYYMITDGINMYLRYNNSISRQEADLFYFRYYKNCDYKNAMRMIDRIIIPVFHISIHLGKAYTAFFNGVVSLRRRVKSKTG